MRIRLHFIHKGYEDFEDSLIIEGDDVEDLRNQAEKEARRRNVCPENCWSEEVTP
jgi:hypothetical protein